MATNEYSAQSLVVDWVSSGNWASDDTREENPPTLLLIWWNYCFITTMRLTLLHLSVWIYPQQNGHKVLRVKRTFGCFLMFRKHLDSSNWRNDGVCVPDWMWMFAFWKCDSSMTTICSVDGNQRDYKEELIGLNEAVCAGVRLFLRGTNKIEAKKTGECKKNQFSCIF